MEYETLIITGFFAILIYIFYLLIFGILHGLKGIIIWSFIALVLVVLGKLVFS